MDKCVACQYYDRQHSNDGKGVMWGQCRRTAPMLHPINAKSYMIEGVWPHVRDDDWCGEWKQTTRRTDTRNIDTASTGPLIPTTCRARRAAAASRRCHRAAGGARAGAGARALRGDRQRGVRRRLARNRDGRARSRRLIA